MSIESDRVSPVLIEKCTPLLGDLFLKTAPIGTGGSVLFKIFKFPSGTIMGSG
jgi:hypothetical protein